jgi:hypothetical protein
MGNENRLVKLKNISAFFFLKKVGLGNDYDYVFCGKSVSWLYLFFKNSQPRAMLESINCESFLYKMKSKIKFMRKDEFSQHRASEAQA